MAAFTHLEEPPEATSSTSDDGRIQFTAARLFASLALFNQLTVPLFIFPITIPIILSAVVSTRRLQAFLAQPEVVGAGGLGGGGEGDVDQKRRREGRRPRKKKGVARADDVVGDDPWLAAAVDDEWDDDGDNDGGEEGGIAQNASLKVEKLEDAVKCGE